MRVFYCSGYALRCFIKVSALLLKQFESLFLRKDQKKQEDVARHLFVFYAYGSSSLVDGGMENKKWAT